MPTDYAPLGRMPSVLAERRATAGGLRTWFGALSDLSAGPQHISIATHSGLEPRHRSLEDGVLQKISEDDAAATLKFLATNSLAYPRAELAPPGLEECIVAGLSALGAKARFHSNGWRVGSWSWTPLTHATFDTGVIGHDDQVGFLFWVDEED